MFSDTLDRAQHRGTGMQPSVRSSRRRSRWRRLFLESLETRRLLATITVTNLGDARDNDPQSTSLREALIQANADLGHDTIQFSPLLFSAGPERITLGDFAPAQGSHLVITESVTIRGPGANKLTIDAARKARHFTIVSGDSFVSAEISGVTLTEGFATLGGGSIYVDNAELTVNESEITLNRATEDGGAILLEARLRRLGEDVPSLIVDKSTIAFNEVSNDSGHGGGVSVVGIRDLDDPSKTIHPKLEIDNSTISRNSAAGEGGALFLDRADAVFRHVTVTGNRTNSDGDSFDPGLRIADVTLINTIVAGNFLGPGSTPFDVGIDVNTNASRNNLIGDANSSGGLKDGEMGNIVGIAGFGVRPIGEILDTVLRDNGGPTRTHALVSASPAIDAASQLFTQDQRTEVRPQGVASDIGSFEANAETVSIEATTDASETGPTMGQFTVTQTAPRPVNLVIGYIVSGTADEGDDYTALSGSVTIPANSLSAPIEIPTIDDALVEELENVTITLDSIISGGAGVTIDPNNDQATILMTDNDSATVSIAATSVGDESGPVNGVFTVTQTAASATATTIAYSVIGGTATSGADFTALSQTVTIPANGTSATIDVPVLDDTLIEGTETLTVRLNSIINGNDEITVATQAEASLDIDDNDSATVRLTATVDGNETGPVDGVFTVTQSALSTVETVVSYTVMGTATSGDDFLALSGSVAIPASGTSATINVSTIDDDTMEEKLETVIITLDSITSGNTEQISIDAAMKTASINIADDDDDSGPAVLDVTGNGIPSPFRDGILIVRFMFDQPDANLEEPALIPPDATRTTGEAIRAHLEAAGNALDVNGDGKISPFEDGILIVRFLFSQPDANLEDPALIPTGSTRTTGAAIRQHLETLLPAPADSKLNSAPFATSDSASSTRPPTQASTDSAEAESLFVASGQRFPSAKNHPSIPTGSVDAVHAALKIEINSVDARDMGQKGLSLDDTIELLADR